MAQAKVTVHIDKTAALLAGNVEVGEVEVAVTPQLLAQLSPDERAALAEALTGGTTLGMALGEHPADAGEATVKALLAGRVERAAARKAEESMQRERQLHELEAARAALEAAPDADLIEEHYDRVGPGRHWAGSRDWYAYKNKAESLGVTPDAKLTQRIDALVAAAKERQARMEDEAAERAMEKERQEKAEADAQRVALDALVRCNGRADQIERLDAGILPADEAWMVVRNVLFDALAKRRRYQALKASDAEHSDECPLPDAESIEYSAEDAESLGQAEWASLKEIRELIKGTSLQATPRVHRAKCSECGEVVEKFSALVTVSFHGHQLSREFAL